MIQKSRYRNFSKQVETLDATLREGQQCRGVNFTLDAKIKIAKELDRLGVHIIEAGWPSASPKDLEFLRALSNENFENAEVAVFTMTRKKDNPASKDENLNSVIESGFRLAVVVGKSWSLHVSEVLKTSLENNLSIIADSIDYLKSHGIEVIFDAEHFFDGYKEDPEYAIRVLRTAEEAHARTIVLADTNGGCLPHEVAEIVGEVAGIVKTPIGVHMHNDSGNAVANTIMAVLSGATHIQVTVNGIGERTGNADLCQVIPNLEFKMEIKSLKNDKIVLRKLTQLSELVYELSGIPRNPYQPYVGSYAFAHKAGLHIDAILKCQRAYEHINPDLVGNRRLLTVSDLSGRSAILAKIAEELGIVVDKQSRELSKLLEEVKIMGLRDINLDDATATVSLLLLKHLDRYKESFEVLEWTSITSGGPSSPKAYGIVKVKINGHVRVEGGEGVGPVHAIDVALRRALIQDYPELTKVRLIDYKVILPEASRDTASLVRVYIRFTDGSKIWCTTATSNNIIEASLNALIQGFDYYLQIEKNKK